MTQTAARKRTTRHVGEIRRFGFQEDVFRRRYELVERTAPNTWTVRLLPIEDDALDAMIADPHCSDDMIEYYIDRTGATMTLRFLSDAEYARHF